MFVVQKIHYKHTLFNFCLTAIGDIEVEEYEMEFLEEEEGDEFLEEGIICPVPGCLNKGHIFKKYNIYVTHYTGS